MDNSNVIGPIPLDDWMLLRMLRTSIDYMKTKVAEKPNLRLAIDRELSIYKDTLGSYRLDKAA